jgi:hypothetical protein
VSEPQTDQVPVCLCMAVTYLHMHSYIILAQLASVRSADSPCRVIYHDMLFLMP